MRVHGYFLFIWFVLQVGNAKPEIQKVVDALNSIQTKVIFAVSIDLHQSQLCCCLLQKVDYLLLLSLLHVQK